MSTLTAPAQRCSTLCNKRTTAALFFDQTLSPGNSSAKRSKWKDVDPLTRKNESLSLLPSSSKTDCVDDNQDLLLAGCLSDLNDMGDAVVGDAGGINLNDVSMSQLLEDFQGEDGAFLLGIDQVEDDGASLFDAGPPSLACPSLHGSETSPSLHGSDTSPSEYADITHDSEDKEKSTKPKNVGVVFFLGHFASVKNNLPRCTSVECNLCCEAPGEIYCRDCKFKSAAAYVPSNNNAEGINDDDAGLAEGNRGVTESVEYAALMSKPCHSPASRRNGNTYERFFAVDNLGDFNSNFQNIVCSKGRDHQISSIPLIVYVMMLALGFEKTEKELREVICGMILEEKVPKYNNFIFNRLEKLGPMSRNKDALKRVSVVVWASMFALDLLAYAESSNEVDKLANVCFLDEKLVEMNNAEVVRLFASLGYSIDLCSRVFEHDMMQRTVMVSCSRYLTKLSNYSGPSKVRTAFKCSLVMSVLNGGISVGFTPELGGDAQYLSKLNPFMEDFCEVVRSGSEESLRHYLDLMIGSLVQPDQAVEVVYCEENKTVLVMPLFILAYLAHLKRTVLKCDTAFECRLLGASNDLNVVNASGEAIKQPSFANFQLKPSVEYATDLVKMLVSTFSQRPLSCILGSGISGETGTFSFNFTPLEGDTVYLGSLVAKIAKSPQQYMNDPRFNYVVRKFHHLFAEVLSVSNKEGIVTSKNAACLTAGVSLSEDEFPVLRKSKSF